MSEPGLPDETPALEALRRDGAAQFDPVGFRHLEAMARRLPGLPAALQPRLQARLDSAIADLAQRFERSRQATGALVATLAASHPPRARELRRLLAAGDHAGVRRLGVLAAQPSGCAPLAQLNQHIRQLRQQAAPGNPLELGAEAATEMQSLRRFRDSWSRIVAEEQVEQAIGRAPDQAGPLNSHMLVLRSLSLMRELSPDYLRRFLSHLDSLLWLEEAEQQQALVAAKPARRTRARK